MLLTDVTKAITDGIPPTDDELAFVMKSADHRGSLLGFADGYLDADELEHACVLWKTYLSYRDTLDEVFARYDRTQRGQLDKYELKAYLESLSGGIDMTNRQVERVLKIANLSKTGLLSKIEVMRATEWWNKYLRKKCKARPVASMLTNFKKYWS